MKTRRLRLIVLVLLGFAACPLAAQPIESLEFISAPVADILVALGLAAGRVVLPDASVEGIASFRFVSTDFYTALASVIQRFGLFATEHEGIITVSRSAIEIDESGNVSIRAELVDPESLIRGVSKATQIPILFDPLPSEPISLFVRRTELGQVLELICEFMKGFELVSLEGAYLLRRTPQGVPAANRPDAVTRRIELAHVSATALMDLIPSSGQSGVELRLDRAGGVATITGRPELVDHFASVIAQIDVPRSGMEYHTFSLSHITLTDLMASLPQHLAQMSIIPHPGSTRATIIGTAEQAAEFSRHIGRVDTPPDRHLFELRHITFETLIAGLPPTARRSQIVRVGDTARFFFLGSKSASEELAEDLARIDCPVPRIRYELLVIQYQSSEGVDYELGLANRVAAPESPHAILGDLGTLLSISFDIVSAFGYHFAARLSSQLAETKAQIVADAVLRGSSGQRVRFQNTDTFRYREPGASSSNEAQSVGVVREITSGLVVDLTGDLVGDSTLLLDVVVSLSKRGVDVSAQGNPPPTSERMIQTQLRAEAGEPVAIGRFAFVERSNGSQGPPVLAAIPGVSGLLGMSEQQVEAGELAIYLIPHVDEVSSSELDSDGEMRRLYSTFFGSAP